ncbi:(R,R)-butanediol dehydrogenase [Penicillium brasilianum]|uniref:(R,R)-butanediol dehydrogenase n=1 Tax=Penicillium brasilianum TaxID=104259 RepID=A0A1S9RRG1_PENBI|nr:(R,R)-butanediol dehydrogenase [Penicillium brasilianum]
MRAVRYHGREDVRVDDVPGPVCGSGQVKIKPAFVGICGSDLHEYMDGPHAVPRTPHPLTGEKLPTTLGHEFSGIVEEVGRDVTDLKVGDKVAVKPNLSDGTCRSCSTGWANCCEKLGFIGYSGSAGGLSDHVVVNRKHAIRLPESIPLEIGALVEPLSVAWHAVNRSPLHNGDTALVVGAGPIGLAIVQVLRAREINTIIVVEVSKRRREFAATFGASHVLDPTEVDAVAEVRAITGDFKGASVAFESSGVQAGLDTAMAGTRVRGTTVILSLWEKKPVLDAFAVVLGEKHIAGAVVYDEGDFEGVIGAIESGKIQPRTMITSTIPMEEIVEKGFKALIHEKDQHIKILVDLSA